MLLRCFGALNTKYTVPLITHCSSARHSQPAAHNLSKVVSAVNSSSLRPVSDLGSTSETSSNSTALKEVSDAAFQEQISRSFVKVPSPAEAALRQIVIAAPEGPTDLDLRAYHVGSRIHIGRFLERLGILFPSCRTTAEKDYAIMWLDDNPAPVYPAANPTVTIVRESLGWLQNKLGVKLVLPPQVDVRTWAEGKATFKPAQAKSSWNLQDYVLGKGQQPAGIVAATRSLKGAADTADTAGITTTLYVPLQEPPVRSELVTVTLPGSVTSAQATAAADTPAQLLLQMPLQPPPVPRKQLQPPFMAVYRSGSVVFGGLSQWDELVWISHLVPRSVRYSGDHSNMWTTSKGRPVPSVVFQESLKVVIDASSPSYAAKGDDQVQLRVLDVGGVRVLTSVLAKSAAFKFYEESVNHALEQLAKRRAAQRASRMHDGVWSSLSYHSIRDRVFCMGRQQDRAQFKVIGASALVIIDAQQLLEMAEPAWHYDAYSKIWDIMAEDQQLEARLKFLETKLQSVEKEAKYDVKARASRRSWRQNQGIIVLLVVSCLVAFAEHFVLRPRRKRQARSSKGNSAESGVEAAVGAS